MTHEEILYLIICIILSCVSFIGGWFAAKYHSLKGGLASNSGVCDDISRNIDESKQRVEHSENELGGIIEAGRRVEDIFNKYRDATEKSSDVE